MKFWSGHGAKIIVLDGSKTCIEDKKLQDFDKNIEYRHLPIPFNERMKVAPDLIKTPFSMLCSDDDFQAPSGVKRCINFLEENNDYEQCSGRSVGFWPYRNFINLRPMKAYHQSYVLDHPNPVERVKFHLTNYMITTIYGVHRSASLKYCLKHAMNNDFRNPYPQETLFEFAAATYGRSKILPFVTWIRSFENDPIATQGWMRNEWLSDWYDNPKYKEQVKAFLNDAMNALRGVSKVKDEAYIQQVVRETINIRVSADRIMAEKKRKSKLEQSLISKLFKPFKRIKSGLKHYSCSYYPSIARLYFSDFYVDSNIFSFDGLKNNDGIEILDTEELSEIWRMVHNFHRRDATSK